LHAPAYPQPGRVAEPAPSLYVPVSGRGRNPPDGRPRSAASRRRLGLPRGPAYLGSNLASSSPSPLCGPRRRAVPRSHPVAGLPAHLLLAGARAESGVPAPLSDPALPEPCGGPPDAHGPLSYVGGPPAVAAVPGFPTGPRVGRLCQTPFWWPCA